MRSVFVFIGGASREDVAAHLDVVARRDGDRWLSGPAESPALYIAVDDFEDATDLEPRDRAWLTRALGRRPEVVVVADVSGLVDGYAEAVAFVLDLLERFGGVACDDHSSACWTRETLVADRETGAPVFFRGSCSAPVLDALVAAGQLERAGAALTQSAVDYLESLRWIGLRISWPTIPHSHLNLADDLDIGAWLATIAAGAHPLLIAVIGRKEAYVGSALFIVEFIDEISSQHPGPKWFVSAARDESGELRVIAGTAIEYDHGDHVWAML